MIDIFKKKFEMKKILFLTLLVVIGIVTDVSGQNGFSNSQIGLSYSYPTKYSDWSNGFLAGNGKMGIIVLGNPLDETVIFNDRKFFLAASHERSFNQVSKSDLKLIRDYCTAENWKAANDLANEVHGWKDGGEGNKHPGFEMLIDIPEDGPVKNYSRVCNYQTGEIIVQWIDNRGSWERRSFVSRKDNVVVQYLKAPSGGKLNCTIQLGIDEGMHFPEEMKFTDASNKNCLNLRVNYPSNTNGAGYEGVTKVILGGGTKNIKDNIITIQEANTVMLLTRTDKYYSDCEKEWNKKEIQEQLENISTDYNTLLLGQIETHKAIFDRVKLDLNASTADRSLSNEELLSKQKSSATAVTAVLERVFDAGRYHYLSSSSEVAPPDLLGIWTGDCNVGWSGYYHLDANLNLQVASGNIGDMPEAMEGYFTLMEKLSDGFKTNASKLLGCRGMLGGGNTAGVNGLISALNYYYPYQYVTGEMGWLLYPFWEHYLITGDKEFLRNRLFPLLKEMGYFYEDFLVNKDKDGNFIFAGSISPESQPSGLGFSLVNNSTFDIAGAKFCLSTLIKTCEILGKEQELSSEIAKWQGILDKLPPYLINDDGALKEWAWPGLGDGYEHRHSSHLITVWPLNEITPESSAKLYKAAQITLNKKDEHNYEDAGHGILHSALNAANLNNAQSVNSKILRLLKTDFFFTSLASAHYSNFKVFCTDVCNTMPAIMMEMLVNSTPEVLDLLPAIPASLKQGAISGIKGRNRVTVENLSWDLDKNTIECTLKSDINQQITLAQRRGIKSISTTAKVNPSSIGNTGRIIELKAGQSVKITLQVNDVLTNIALGRPANASSISDNSLAINATDGNEGTRWLSAYNDNEWISVDLGSAKEITSIKLNWEAAYGKAYKLQVSDDGSGWTDIYTEENGNGDIDEIPVNHVTGRYVRFLGQKRGTSFGYSLWEIEVYGVNAIQQNTNLALNRAAYHSSSINYNNTGHLVTDGNLMSGSEPAAISSQYTDSPSGEDVKNIFDGSIGSKFLTFHKASWVQYDFPGDAAYPINKYTVSSANDIPSRDPKSWVFSASNNGTEWIILDSQADITFSERLQTKTYEINNTTPYKIYRLNITDNAGAPELQFSESGLYEGEIRRIEKKVFSSEWVSDAGSPQWVYIDLGANCNISGAKLFWDNDYAKAYKIEVSNDKLSWQTTYSTNNADGNEDEISFSSVTGRYVRMAASQGVGQTYSLIEFEVYGTGGSVITSDPMPEQQDDGKQFLTGGNWKLKRADDIEATGVQISNSDFDDHNWIVATVPGTVLNSYLKNGAIPDPDFGDQQLQISDAYFTTDFWYRNSFKIPENYEGKKVWLNFNGINWKADVFVNGINVGRINGAFIRGKFDITSLVQPGDTACLAVFIHKNDTPGTVTVQTLQNAGGNGGVLGADNPTIHASIGWDWVPTIRGRNTGIQDDVFLSASREVSIADPFIVTKLPLPSTVSADIKLSVDLQNHSNSAVTGILKGTINPGNITFSQNVSVDASKTKSVTVDPQTFSQLMISNPKLWWPNGYGNQDMYEMSLSFEINGEVSDLQVIRFGIREVTTDVSDKVLEILVNGVRIFMRGGNWGLSESMLRLDAQGYDDRVRLHKEENFTMIRNWVGMTGDDDFYKVCDKYGVMIWDDFWLANPGDGPNPNDPDMFMQNAIDKLKRVRNHPSVALYCGRNEGNPPTILDTKLVAATSEYDGTRPYIPHSAADMVSGFGPYSVQHPKWYFQNRSGKKLHSEMGMPNMPSVESLKEMLPQDKLWPINEVWGLHDYCNSAQGAQGFTDQINNSYGTATGIDDFCRKAQMVNMENHKAMFEPFAGAGGNGLLMWMSQSAWPSMVWQTYDYYLEQTAGYYGCKKACEPLHILWDCNSNKIKVSNNTGRDYTSLTAVAEIYNLNAIKMYADSVQIDSHSDQVIDCFTMTFPSNLSATHFIKLKLKKGNEVLSDNFYWRGNTYQNYIALNDLDEVNLEGTISRTASTGKNTMTAKITNPGPGIALMVRLKLLKGNSDERVLPTFYSDNYFSLLPNETKEVTLEFDAGSDEVRLMVEGWNIKAEELNDIETGFSEYLPTEKQPQSNYIELFPNPTATILYAKGLKEFNAQVFDLSGKKVMQDFAIEGALDISKLFAGIYIVYIDSLENYYYGKFMKQ